MSKELNKQTISVGVAGTGFIGPAHIEGLRRNGIQVVGLAEEAPEVYKPSTEVVDVVHNVGIAKKVARLVPLGAHGHRVVGVDQSKLLRWLIRNRQKAGIQKRYHDTRDELERIVDEFHSYEARAVNRVM